LLALCAAIPRARASAALSAGWDGVALPPPPQAAARAKINGIAVAPIRLVRRDARIENGLYAKRPFVRLRLSGDGVNRPDTRAPAGG
jgi:hypothetical protein